MMRTIECVVNSIAYQLIHFLNVRIWSDKAVFIGLCSTCGIFSGDLHSHEKKLFGITKLLNTKKLTSPEKTYKFWYH